MMRKAILDTDSVLTRYPYQTVIFENGQGLLLDHKSIVPFDELSKETQDRDIKYAEALRKIAKEIRK